MIGSERIPRTPLRRIALGLMCGLAMMFASVATASASSIVFAGIDAEEGGPGGHGPIANYCQLVDSMLADVDGTKAAASGILVIGNDGVTGDGHAGDFYAAIDACTTEPLSYSEGAAAITAQPFTAFKMLIVVSSDLQVPGNGLTQEEQDALVDRNSDVTDHVNSGGALLGFTQFGLTNQFQYVGGVGTLVVNNVTQYDDITPTPAGTARGITNDLDVCCWHDTFSTIPSGFDVLAFMGASGDASAIGTGGAVSTEDCTNGIDDDGDDLVDGADPDCQTTEPENCTNGIDDDGDGDIDGADSDCASAGATCFGMPETGGPTNGDDVIIGTVGPDNINSLHGDDAICSLPGDDILQGNNGNDRIRAGNGNDNVGGEQGDDTIYGGLDSDNVRGAGNDDYVNGQNGRDTVTGGRGDDHLFGGSGPDTLRGQEGFDVCTGNSGVDTFQGCEVITDGPT